MKRAPIVFHYGCMASEKSLALIQEYRKSSSVGEVCLCFVPKKNEDPKHIVSRFMAGEESVNSDEIKIPAIAVKDSAELHEYVRDYVNKTYAMARAKGLVVSRLRINVLIDEVQLFDDGIKKVIERIAHNGIHVVCAGLDLDFRGDPFPLQGKEHVSVPEIMGISSELHRHYARCAHVLDDGAPCGANATRTQRFRDSAHTEPSHYDDPTIVVPKDVYIPACEEHHVVPGKHNRLLN
ncbi:thymidine kinase [Nanoarchaeota archaeon]